MNAFDKPTDFTPELFYARDLSEKATYRSADGIIYEWTGAHWQAQTGSRLDELERNALHFISNSHPKRATAKIAKSAVDTATTYIRTLPTNDSKLIIIPCSNGSVVVEPDGEIQFRENKPDDGITFSLSCAYDPSADCPRFNQFLDEILDKESQDYVQGYAGYSLLTDTRHQVALWLKGSGRNGKGTLIEIISSLHPQVAAVSLSDLSGFALESLVGTPFVWVDETPKKFDEQKLKSLISGGLIQVDRKFRSPISIRPIGKWWICANDLPILGDQTFGFWRRFIIIDFLRQFADHEVKATLAQDIIEGELSGVLNWCLNGLSNLLYEGRLPAVPSKSQLAKESAQVETNSVACWISDQHVHADSRPTIAKTLVYQKYRDWCLDNGMSPVNSTKFWSRVAALIPAIEETRPRVAGQRVKSVDLGFGEDD